jgi:hypothetical protein
MRRSEMSYESAGMRLGIAAFVSAHFLEITEATARLRAKQAGLDFRQVELCNQFALAACRAALMLQEGDIDEARAMAELEHFGAPKAFKRTMIHELVRKLAARAAVCAYQPSPHLSGRRLWAVLRAGSNDLIRHVTGNEPFFSVAQQWVRETELG